MKIEVTQEDINIGVPRSALRCPVAVALKRITGEEFLVNPHGPNKCVQVSRHTTGYDFITVPNSSWISELLSKFDEGGGMMPFTFEANLGESATEEEE